MVLMVVLNGKNLGVGGGRNAGFTKVNRQLIVAIDDDRDIAAEDLLSLLPDLRAAATH